MSILSHPWWRLWPWLPGVALLAMLIVEGLGLSSTIRTNAGIERLLAREDVEVSSDSAAELVFARAWMLAETAREEEAADLYFIAEQLGSPLLRARAYYNLGNLQLRRAVALAEKLEVDRSRMATQLAKDSYREALRRQPGFWNAKYNLEAAQRLVRDLPTAEGDKEKEGDQPPEDMWSQMPGFPSGLP
jgi:mxaK protein